MKARTAGIGLALALAASSLPAMAQAPAGPKEPTRVAGRVLDKGTNTLQVQGMQDGKKYTVNVDDATQYARFEAAVPADFAPGYLVAVSGNREGNKITPYRLARLAQVEGTPTDVQWKAAEVVGRLVTRGTRSTSTQPEPIIAQVSSLAPPKVKLRSGQELDVAVSANVRMSRYKEITFADLPKASIVVIVPKETAPATTITARAVIERTDFGGGAPAAPAPKR